MTQAHAVYLGSMTGTSLDGLDLAAVAFDTQEQPQLLHCKMTPYPQDLKQALMDICQNPDATLSENCRLDSWLGEFYASTINQFLSENDLSPDQIEAIGSHGQTVRHNISGAHPYTLQIGDPNIIAAKTGLKVVADFRRRDIALGGQGAPLAPAFHRHVFHDPDKERVVINIGGIANITHIPADSCENTTGFDTGPGNTLMDNLCQQNLGMPYDEDGRLARAGSIHESALQEIFKQEAYFSLAPPKSTGTDYFSLNWLQQFDIAKLTLQDLLATLTELTAISIYQGIASLDSKVNECFVCGGGAHNVFLLSRLQHHLQETPLHSSEKLGIHPDWVEAMTFAWLAKQTIEGKPGNLPSVTNSHKSTILGAIYF